MENSKRKKLLFFLTAASFGILAMLPSYFWGIPTGADFANHFRFALPFYEEIAKGNLFPAWLGESNYGFGDPRFRFYPPFLYYVLAAFRFISADWYVAVFLTFTLFSVVGAVGVYLWTRQNLSAQTAIFASLIFVFAPYHLTQFYQAALLAEFAAISFLPFAFMFVEQLLNKNESPKKLFNLAGLAIFYALIVVTHLPTTVISSLSLGFFALLLTDWKNYKKGLIFCAVGIFLGLAMSAFFWVKMLSELSLTQAGTGFNSGYYDYRNNFIFSPYALTNLNNWVAGVIAALTIGFFLPVSLIFGQILKRKPDELTRKFLASDNEVIRKRLFAALILALSTFTMTTDLSRPIWAIIPKLKDVQFPFRWLTIISLMICPLIALAVQVWRERLRLKNLRVVQFVLLFGFVISAVYSTYTLAIDSEFLTREKFLETVESSRNARSFNDWLPRGAKEFKDLQPLEGNANAGKREIKINNWQREKRNLTVAAGEETQIRLKTYYYPRWKAYEIKYGKKFPLITEQAEDGTLLVTISNEATEIEVVFIETLTVIIALILSAIGWLFAFGFLLVGRRKIV